MADVYAALFILIAILVSVPALLVALNILLPRTTTVAYQRLRETPGTSFALGLPVTLAFIGWILLTANVGGGLLQALAFLSTMIGMGLGSIGGAGLARLLGERLGRMSDDRPELTQLVRGAVVYELACLVPFVGWFLFLPLAGMTAIGAAVFGLVRWSPGAARVPETTPPPLTAKPVPSLDPQMDTGPWSSPVNDRIVVNS